MTALCHTITYVVGYTHTSRASEIHIGENNRHALEVDLPGALFFLSLAADNERPQPFVSVVV